MSEKILVVHTHPLIAEAVRRVALGIGAQALCTTTFSDAKRLIEQWKPFLVLADLALDDAFGDMLPGYAKARGVEQVWALCQEYKKNAYRRPPARDYGTDGWLTLSEVPRDLGPRVVARWNSRFSGGRGDDTQGAMNRLCALILRHSDLVQSWELHSVRESFDAWFAQAPQGQGTRGTEGIGPDIIDDLFYSAGLGCPRSEAV